MLQIQESGWRYEIIIGRVHFRWDNQGGPSSWGMKNKKGSSHAKD